MPSTFSKPITRERQEVEDKENIKIGVSKKKRKTKHVDSDSDSSIEVIKVFTPNKKKTKQVPFEDEESAYISACMDLNAAKRVASNEFKEEQAKLEPLHDPNAPFNSAHFDITRKNRGAIYEWSDATVEALAEGRKLKLETKEDFDNLVQEVHPFEVEKETEDDEERNGELVGCKGFAKFKREAIGEESPPRKPRPNECRSCLCSPCIIDQEQEAGHSIVEHAIAEDWDMNKIRFALYRMYAFALHYKPRTELPRCVTRFIVKHFPDPDGEHTGHKEKEEFA